MGFWERALLGDVHSWACSLARGEVLEIAIGTGLNLSHYAADVHLTGIEFSPAMLEIARRRAEEIGRDADLRLGDAEQLEFADESFDTVVCAPTGCARFPTIVEELLRSKAGIVERLAARKPC